MGVWHTYSTRQTLSELETDKSRGLSGAEAERRLARWGPNRLEEGRRQGLLLRFLGQMKDPMILVLLAAAALSLWASGGEDWLDAAIILVIVVVNACISISQEDSAEKALEALRKMSAPLAKVVRDGALQRLETDRLVPGDIIHLEAGDLVPADARILEAASLQADESAMTGESVPVAKRPGGAVYAGTVVEEGECALEVKQASGQGRYDQIVDMIQRSEQMKSAAEAKASNLADKLVPYTFAGSLLDLLLTRNVTRALSVLMVDFSCALKLAMPLAVMSAMREAGREHITVKGGRFLEATAKADTIIFDKTGTLTHACPQVAQIIPFNGKNEAEMLRLAACLEEHFPHSMANAVVEAARRRGLRHEERHAKVEYLVAHGIASSVDGEQVRIGSAHFIFEDEKVRIPEGEQEKFDTLPPEFSQLYLAIDGVLSAVICISDPLREEAKDVFSALRRLGVKKTVMLTGDSPRTAAAIAAQLGVDDFRAGVLPADKAEYVAALRREGHTVLMVGDGINDSPALSEADAGIAISDGAAIAREIADITIAADSLWELVQLRQLAMALMNRIQANYRFVIGFNGALIGLGAAGVLPPATSAMLHNLSTLGVSLHSMRALPLPKSGQRF